MLDKCLVWPSPESEVLDPEKVQNVRMQLRLFLLERLYHPHRPPAPQLLSKR